MSPSCSRQNPLTYDPRKLVGQYYAQRIPEDRYGTMQQYSAVCFRPGGYTSSFEGRTILPAGVAVMFTLAYEPSELEGGSQRLHIPLRAFTSQADQEGNVAYDEDACRLHMDLSRRPRARARGTTIDPERNPSLLDTGLRMDKACQRAAANRWQLPAGAFLPRVLLAYSANRLPKFRDTLALRQCAAQRLGVPMEQLGSNGELLLDRLLQDTWEASLIQPQDPRNPTGGAVLIDARFCPGERAFLRAYEDFTELLGVPTWNPARDVKPPQFENPAKRVLIEVGLGETPDFNQEISAETIRDMLARMREYLGEHATGFSDEDLMDGITTPKCDLIAWHVELPRLRAALPVWARECATDDDLKQATQELEQPLWVRNACRIQVIRWTATVTDSEGVPLRHERTVADEVELQLTG